MLTLTNEQEHTLFFPVLDYIAKEVTENGKQQKSIARRLTRVEQVLTEQKTLLEQFEKKTFSLKEEHLQVNLLYKIACICIINIHEWCSFYVHY